MFCAWLLQLVFILLFLTRHKVVVHGIVVCLKWWWLNCWWKLEFQFSFLVINSLQKKYYQTQCTKCMRCAKPNHTEALKTQVGSQIQLHNVWLLTLLNASKHNSNSFSLFHPSTKWNSLINPPLKLEIPIFSFIQPF